MTTAEFAAPFPAGNTRPESWQAGQYRQYAALRDQAVAAENRADRLWLDYWWNDRPAAGSEGEAHVFQAIDVLLRLSGLLMLEAAGFAC